MENTVIYMVNGTARMARQIKGLRVGAVFTSLSLLGMIGLSMIQDKQIKHLEDRISKLENGVKPEEAKND